MRAWHGDSSISRSASWLLLAGLLLAIALMITGAVLAAAGGGGPVARQSSVSGLPAALIRLEPGGFFDLGLLVLLATPIARVFVLLVGFSRSRAWPFVGISLAVMVILALSALLGMQAD